MAIGDVYYVDVPERTGMHMAVIVAERDANVVIIFGQTEAHHGAHVVKPSDPVAREFSPRLKYETHFHKNNLAVMPAKNLPSARLGHIDDHLLPGFRKAAQSGLVLLGQIREGLRAAEHMCQCNGGCKRHAPPCPSKFDPAVGHSVLDWRITPRKTVVCRACFTL